MVSVRTRTECLLPTPSAPLAVVRWGLFLFLLLVSVLALAAPTTPATPALATALSTNATPAAAVGPALESTVPDIGGSVLRVFGALLIVVGVFLGGIWALRNWPRLTRRGPRRQNLRVVECKSLGARQALWVVAYQKQRLLVASSPAGIVLVSPLPDDEALDATEVPPADFATAFRQVLGRDS